MIISRGNILVIAFLFLLSLNCCITYLCSSSALKVLAKTNSFSLAINKIRIYDKYLLNSLTLLTSASYVALSYYYLLELLQVSDYFLALSTLLGFVLSIITTFFSRLCYCYACNVLLKTKLREYECFKENFLYLLRIFFPIFLISFIVPTIYLLPITNLARNLLSIAFILSYLVIWIFSAPFKTIINLNARKMKNKDLVRHLSKLFADNNVKRYRLYYWDSSKTNEANALVNGFFIYYVFISTSLIENVATRELQAVLLHEIGHIKNHHFTKMLISKLSLLIIISLLLFFSFNYFRRNIYLLVALIFAFVIVLGINLKGSKKYEDEADLYVNQKGYGKELITALKKIGYTDIAYNKLDEIFSNHPDVNKRIDNLGKKQ